MTKRSHILSGLILVLAAGLFAGCGSSDNPTLAVVGDYEIKANELDEYYRRVRHRFPTPQDEYDKRRELLDTAIVNRLLIESAYEKGIDQSEELARVVLANKDKFLVDVLAQKKILDPAQPSEAEIRDAWEKLEYKVRASHILVDNPDTAQALLERIRSGESFEKLAFEHSIDPSAKKNKGDLGYFTWGQMVDEFQEACWAMEPGEVSTPVKTDFGWHIIKLVDRLTNEYREDYDKMKIDIRNQLRGRKQKKLADEYIASIREKYPIRVDTTTCSYLLHKREQIYPPMLLETLPRNDFDPEQLDRNEKELVLATWDGGQLTVMEYLDLAKRLPASMKPNFDQYDSLASAIFSLKQGDILTVEALREGLDSDPEYLRRVKLFKELVMADIMKNDSIPAPDAPDEKQARLYYDEHPDEFTDPARVHVFEILLSDELKANKLAKDINSLPEFKERAMDLTERAGKRASGGDLGFIERKWFPEIYDLAVNTPIGAIGGPVVTQGKYSLFYVADRIESSRKDFLQVKNQIVKKIQDDQQQAALAAWVDERKQNTDIQVYEDQIWKTIDMEQYPETGEESSTEQG
jgi:peptidyl-prolyl cis-trans isomerase C